MPRFRRKPILVEAIQFTGLSSLNQMVNEWGKDFSNISFYNTSYYKSKKETDIFRLYIETPTDTEIVLFGHWVVKDENGFHVYNSESFKKNYEPEDNDIKHLYE